MVRYNLTKLEQLILYIVSKNQDVLTFGNTQLADTLFRSEFEYFRQTGQAITGTTYVKMPYGPAPDGFGEILKRMVGCEKLALEADPAEQVGQKRATALQEPDLMLFTSGEIEVVDRVIAETRGKTAAQVSDNTRGSVGWRVASPHERIPFGTVWLSAPEPTEEEREYAAALSDRRRQS